MTADYILLAASVAAISLAFGFTVMGVPWMVLVLGVFGGAGLGIVAADTEVIQ